MFKQPIFRFIAIVVAFILLSVGYVYFNEESLKSSAQANADIVAQMIEDGDVQGVITKLEDFVGTVNPNDQKYNQALISLSYASTYVEEGGSLNFVEGELGSNGEYRVYSAVYEVPEPQGGQDYFVVVLRREEGTWLLANTQIAAENPLQGD